MTEINFLFLPPESADSEKKEDGRDDSIIARKRPGGTIPPVLDQSSSLQFGAF